MAENDLTILDKTRELPIDRRLAVVRVPQEVGTVASRQPNGASQIQQDRDIIQRECGIACGMGNSLAGRRYPEIFPARRGCGNLVVMIAIGVGVCGSAQVSYRPSAHR